MCAACPGAEARQPIAYNHRVHVGEYEIACDNCHEGCQEGIAAGYPTLGGCGECHAEPQGKTAEEAKVVRAVAAGRELPWERLYGVPGHVFFSHRRHTKVADLACVRCHGDMGSQTRPPGRPLIALSMGDCMDCHRERGASNDCTACHR